MTNLLQLIAFSRIANYICTVNIETDLPEKLSFVKIFAACCEQLIFGVMKFNAAYIIILLLTINLPYIAFAQQVKFRWNTESEKKELLGYTTVLKKLAFNDKQIKDISSCSLIKIKLKYPNGINMTEQQLIEVNDDILSSCVQDAKLIVIPPINNELALTLKDQVFAKIDSSISEVAKMKLSECFVSTMISKYPKGIIFEQENSYSFKKIMNNIGSDCAEQLILKSVINWDKETESLFKYGFTKTLYANTSYALCLLTKFKEKFPKGYVVDENNKLEMNKMFDELKSSCH